MLEKNREAKERKERRMQSGTFIGFRPHRETLKTTYDRKALKRETRKAVVEGR